MAMRGDPDVRVADPETRPVTAWRGGGLWSDPKVGFLLAGALAAVFAGLGAWLTPRGPVTTAHASISMGVALAVGLIGGFVAAHRWSLLVLPAVYMLAFEAGRVGMVGPTVDAIHLDAFYGIVAFVVGRVVHGILVVMPMAVGLMYGSWLASRAGRREAVAPGAVGWVLTVLGSVAVVTVAVSIARPASTAAIESSHSTSVAELATVPIGGHDQVLMIRGQDVGSPVLLYLAGGPGGTDLGAMRREVGLEQDFVVVAWEQRGAGKSYPALDPTSTLTVDQLVADTIEITEYLRARFHKDKIFLVGQSWGSTLGVLAAQTRPDLYHAFVGVGQMVSQRETDVMFWEDTLAWAETTGNRELGETLRRNGPPPYSELLLYDPVVSHEHEWNAYPELDLSNEMPGILFVPEYTFMDRVNAFRGFLDTNATLYPQLQGIDFRQDVPRLDVPLYMVLGEHEARGRAVLAEEWFAMVEAPAKERFVFEGAGHRANFDRPGEFATVMRKVAKSAPAR
ncbi:MAG TPA: alpha/beta hydrolase [Acidimicrobiia bacterium]|nr:alpha/beta hydrolase [Acidimicrobiia bacterium]